MQLQINELQAKHEALTKKLEKISEEGPEAIAKLETETAKTRDNANRWTGKILLLTSSAGDFSDFLGLLSIRKMKFS